MKSWNSSPENENHAGISTNRLFLWRNLQLYAPCESLDKIRRTDFSPTCSGRSRNTTGRTLLYSPKIEKDSWDCRLARQICEIRHLISYLKNYKNVLNSCFSDCSRSRKMAQLFISNGYFWCMYLRHWYVSSVFFELDLAFVSVIFFR